MKKFVLPIVAVLVIAVGIFAVSCTSDDDLQNLLEIATSTAGLESLVNVILYVEENASEDPGITDDLADESLLFTVFAPNNEAFVTLFELFSDGVDADEDGIVDATDIEQFLTDSGLDADTLLVVLALHVIEDQKLMATDVVAADGSSIGPTIAEVDLNVTVDGETVTIEPDIVGSSGADIASTDVEASNGVAHVIDAVLLPPLE